MIRSINVSYSMRNFCGAVTADFLTKKTALIIKNFEIFKLGSGG